MTETLSPEALAEQEALASALSLIDRGLADISERSLVSSAEVADMLLDLRGLLAARAATLSAN